MNCQESADAADLEAREDMHQRFMLTLMVADNGRGFHTRKLAESGGLGLAGRRERASLLDGRVEIQSQPRKGTRVLLSLPIDGRGSITQ